MSSYDQLWMQGMTRKTSVIPTLDNPFEQARDLEFTIPGQMSYEPGLYENALRAGYDLIQRPRKAAGVANIQKQHLKKRMTVWERIDVLKDPGTEPTVLFQNW